MNLDWVTILAIVVIVAGVLYFVMKRRRKA
jgi:LPXTG-motif cell wall-anchored protein